MNRYEIGKPNRINMNPQPKLPRRYNSLRYPIADYSDPGVYFITLCTHPRESLFGKIINEQMHCNAFGTIIWDVWKTLPKRYPQIELDAAIVMPDHFHGLIIIREENTANHGFTSTSIQGEESEFPLGSLARRRMTIPLVIGYFKMNTAKRINLLRGTPGEAVWQRNYYDMILRSDKDYDSLVEYIMTNPQRWGLDKD